jgi:putative transcriptional regulator
MQTYITLSEARRQKKLSQEKVARCVDISLRSYQTLERDGVMPSVVTALMICELLSVDPREIQEWNTWRETWKSPIK